MDAVDSVVEPLREFAKDIVRLVKRRPWVGPARKASLVFRSGSFSSLARSDPDSARRVHQGGRADDGRVRRLLRQPHLQPHQQHHRRLSLGYARVLIPSFVLMLSSFAWERSRSGPFV
ncbi:hypothetical protein ZWY2020_004861 [Hordeum vulgare]|nr:hypothetical protein ZWY2020_004861 [Hordeum vulgare]